jgi:hypothetical protein
MSALLLGPAVPIAPYLNTEDANSYRSALLNGDVLVKTRPHNAFGGAVTACIYLPMLRSRVWQHLTNYPRWVEYFPDMLRSDVLQICDQSTQGYKRLYQAAGRVFFFVTAQVEIYLRAFETAIDTACPQILFRFERGSFTDFAADLMLQTWADGTLLMYTVKATPTIPIPSMLIEQAMQMELPANMRVMRQVLQSV